MDTTRDANQSGVPPTSAVGRVHMEPEEDLVAPERGPGADAG